MAFDSTGVKTPDRIQFMRKSNFAIYTNLTANENLYFTARTELEEVVGPDGGKPLIYIKKKESYRCFSGMIAFNYMNI